MEDLILKEHKLREDIVQIINASNLPAFILEPIIKDVYSEVNKLKEQQYNEAVLAQSKKKESDKKWLK